MFLTPAAPAVAGAVDGGGLDTTTLPFEMMTAAEVEATSCVAALAASCEATLAAIA